MGEITEASLDELQSGYRPRSCSLPSRRTNIEERQTDEVFPTDGPYRTPEQPRDRPSILKHQEVKSSTIRQHYYPEGGWGWIICVCAFLVHCLTTGLQLSYGVLYLEVLRHFGKEKRMEGAWLGSLSLSSSLLIAPIVVAFCRRKSIRLTAVFGGLTSALGCLFNSFAKEMHQVIFSYGIVMAIGLGVAREASNLMIGQYFKRKRETVELIVLSGVGVGVAIFSAFLMNILRILDWRLGLHVATGVVFLMFFIGIFYRSASLYHPQRRAILHLKNQRRKIKANNVRRPPFFDFSTLKITTMQIILVSTFTSTFGVYTPLFYFRIPYLRGLFTFGTAMYQHATLRYPEAYLAGEEGIEEASIILLQCYLGFGFVLGCVVFGFLTIKHSTQCLIARQYLCQAAMVGVGLSILASHAVHGYHGYVLFVMSYGLFCGGYQYTLKMFVFESVRTRNFARAWGYVQCCQFLPVLVGIPITGYTNSTENPKLGLFFSAACAIVGAIFMFLLNCCKKTSDLKSHDRSVNVDGGQAVVADGICACHHVENDGMKTGLHKCQRSISFAHCVEVVDDDDLELGLDKIQDCITCMEDDGVFELGEHKTTDNLSREYRNKDMFQYNVDKDVKRNKSGFLAHYDPNIIHISKRPMSVIEEVTSTV